MKQFWHFARGMFRYRWLLIVTLLVAVLDALCALGGFGTLMLVIEDLLGRGGSARDLLLERLNAPGTQQWIGDWTAVGNRLPTSPFAGFAVLLGLIAAFATVGTAFRFIYGYAAITVAYRTTLDIRRAAFQRLVHLPMIALAQEGMADNLSRLVRDSAQIARGLQTLLGKAVRSALMGAVCLVVALWVDLGLSLIFMLGLVPITVLIRRFGKVVRRAASRAMRGYGRMLGAVQESLGALAVVKVHQAEGYERRRFNTLNRRVYTAEMKARKTRAFSAPVVELLALLGVIAVALLAGWWVFDGSGRTDSTSLVKVLMMLAAAGASLRPLANLNNELNEAAAAAARLQEVLSLPVEANARGRDRKSTLTLPHHRRSVHFDGVTFRYPHADRPAVDSVDLEVPFGRTVAVVGPNGAGKSTLLNLLPRLLDPTEGRVLVDGTDVATVNLRSLRDQIAVVPQYTVLFEGTISENIAYGRRHVSKGQIEAAAAAAYAHDFIRQTPNDYDTHLGEGGEGLSGGQKQRLCLARAILRNPSLLILDEATSQIDADSEQKINQALFRFCTGRTTFIIAHRLSTVINADLIVVMDDGRVIDYGSHADLLKRCVAYQLLTRTQLQPPAA